MPPVDPNKHAPQVNDQVYDSSRIDKRGDEGEELNLQPNGFIFQLGKDDDGQLEITVKFHDARVTMRYSRVTFNYNEHFKGRWNGVNRWVLHDDFDTEAEQHEETEREIDALCGLTPMPR